MEAHTAQTIVCGHKGSFGGKKISGLSRWKPFIMVSHMRFGPSFRFSKLNYPKSFYISPLVSYLYAIRNLNIWSGGSLKIVQFWHQISKFKFTGCCHIFWHPWDPLEHINNEKKNSVKTVTLDLLKEIWSLNSTRLNPQILFHKKSSSHDFIRKWLWNYSYTPTPLTCSTLLETACLANTFAH